MKRLTPTPIIGCLLASLLLMPVAASAQDTAAVNPHIVKVLYEDDHIRILEVKSKPGAVEDWHGHPGYFVYALTDGKLKISLPDGTSRVAEFKKGRNVRLDPVKRHKGENISGKLIELLLVELKDTRPMAQSPSGSAAQPATTAAR